MSKKPSTKKAFAYKTTIDLPKLNKIKTEWDLKKHYYKSESDPQIEKDVNFYIKEATAFVKKYQGKDFTSSAAKLLKILKDNEKLAELPQGAKVMFYFYYRLNLNVNDNAARKKDMQYAEKFKKLSNQMLFFPLTLGKIPKNKQAEYLKDKNLSKYHYFLKSSFEEAKHHLTEAEEKILTLRSNTSSGMWAEATEKILGNRSITFKKKVYSVPEATEAMHTFNWSDKQKIWSLIMDQNASVAEFAEHELSAIVNHNKVTDELRGYKNPYSATVLSYENNETAVENLVSAISKEGFALSKKFYKIKAGLHNLKTIPYANKYDSIGKLPQPDFETCVTICRDTFYKLDQRYGEIFDRMLENGHIDVWPKAGKRGGAFMSGDVNQPTFVMLNQTNSVKALETMAHEMGHAIHTELSKSQPAIYQGYSITTAETASTFFEQLVSNELLKQLPEKDKVVFLHDKIAGDIATIQRQIACFNFSLEMNHYIREHGVATKEELAKMMQKHLQAYLGSAVQVTEKDGYSYVYWHHIRSGFYVYTYAYGFLISSLMARNYREDANYLEKVNQFLQSGGKDTVENIFASIGINTNKIETFTDSLKNQAEEIKLLEKLTKK